MLVGSAANPCVPNGVSNVVVANTGPRQPEEESKQAEVLTVVTHSTFIDLAVGQEAARALLPATRPTQTWCLLSTRNQQVLRLIKMW